MSTGFTIPQQCAETHPGDGPNPECGSYNLGSVQPQYLETISDPHDGGIFSRILERPEPKLLEAARCEQSQASYSKRQYQPEHKGTGLRRYASPIKPSIP